MLPLSQYADADQARIDMKGNSIHPVDSVKAANQFQGQYKENYD
jgi:hypothetical protein